MRHKTPIYLSILLSLFLFQSLWNIAAAFCDHDLAEAAHFGHHVALHYESQHQHAKGLGFLDQDDHHDHLPSFSPIFLANLPHKNLTPIVAIILHQPNYYWSNSYRPPDLSLNNPPPLSVSISI